MENINYSTVKIFNIIVTWDKILNYSILQGFKKCYN